MTKKIYSLDCSVVRRTLRQLMNVRNILHLNVRVTKILVLVMRDKALSGMMAAASKGGTSVEDTIRQKIVSDIAVQTTNEEGLVPLPVSDVAI